MADHLQAVNDDEPPPKPADVEPVYTQPSVRVLQTWNPTQLRSAISSSDGGYMSFAAELCDNLISDEIIGGALETRTGGLQGLDLDFRDGRGDESGDSPLAPQLEEDWYHAFPEAETKQLAAWGLILGVGFGEQVWGIFNDRFVPRLKIWHPKNFTFNYSINRWQVRVDPRDGQDVSIVTIEPNDPKWIVYTPYGEHRPWARGLWRGLARWWLAKNYAINDMAEHGEKAALLVITATGDRSPTPGQREELANSLHSIGKDGTAALPTGFDIKLVEAKANIQEIYIVQVIAANSAFVLSINGQNLTTEVKGGSFAAASVHERVEARRIRTDGETLSTTLRSQSIVYWTEWNFGASAVAPWPQWDTDPPADEAVKATVFDTTAKALVKIKTAGFAVRNVDEMSEEFGIPELDKVNNDGNGNGGGDDPGEGGGDGSGGGGTATNRAGGANPKQRLASGLPIAQTSESDDDETGVDDMDTTSKAELEEVVELLRDHPRAILCGGPRSGKTTVAVRASERYGRTIKHGDALVASMEWSECSQEVSTWFGSDGEWVIEGVVCARAIRKWLAANPGEALDAFVVRFSDAVQVRTTGQETMAKGEATVWDEIEAELQIACNGVHVCSLSSDDVETPDEPESRLPKRPERSTGVVDHSIALSSQGNRGWAGRDGRGW